MQKLYEEAGYPDEWKMHHQGGPTGYGCREFVVTPSEDRCIHEGQAYASNPTIQGTKVDKKAFKLNAFFFLYSIINELLHCQLLHSRFLLE